MAPPTTWFPPHFADAVGHETVTKPSDTFLGHGYAPDEPLAAEHLNWYLQAMAQWLASLSGGLVFPTPEAAIAALIDSQTSLPTYVPCIIDEYDADQRPGSVKTSVIPVGVALSVDVSGRSVVWCVSGSAVALAKERDLTTAVATYNLAGAAVITSESRVITDGIYTLVSYDTFVDCFGHDSGTLLWTYDHGAAVYDIAMDGTRVYIVGELGTANKHARGVTLATGVQAWAYRHSAGAGDALYSVATNGRQVFVAGEDSSYASGATLRALEASTGNDATNEGGTAADTTGMAWNDVQVSQIVRGKCLATDGRSLFLGYADTAARELEKRGCDDGTIVASVELADSCTSVAVDQRYVFTSDDADHVIAFEKDLTRAWQYIGAETGAKQVVSDGSAVFMTDFTGLAGLVKRLYRGNTAETWRRVNTAHNHLPFRQLIIPQR